jgi:hypothetical protein
MLDKLAEQLKGQVYDELTKKTKWQVTVYSGNPDEEGWKRSYPVPNLVVGYLLREALYEEFKVFGVLNDKSLIIIHVECFNPETPEDGFFEWYDETGCDIDLYEMDENFNFYLQSFYAD